MAVFRAALQAVLVVAFVGGALMGVRWLVATKPVAPQKEAREPVYAVEAAMAAASDNQPRIAVFGEVEARRAVELRALVAGPVIAVNPRLIVGERIEAGALLVRIDPFAYEGAVTEARANLAETEAKLKESEAELKAAESDLASLRAQLALSERDLERARRLAASDNVSERTVDEREMSLVQTRQQLETSEASIAGRQARVAQQKANLQRLEWRLRQAERDLADTELRAPFAAVVRSENVGLGKRLGVNDVVAELYEADALDVRFTLSDSQFGRLTSDEAPLIGRNATLTWAVGGAPIAAEARVDRIGPDVSSTSGGVSVIGEVLAAEGGSALRPGAFVTVALPDRRFPGSYRLPETALYDGDHVYALTPVRSDASMEAEEAVFALSRLPARPLAWDGEEVLLEGGLDGLWILTSRLAEAGEGVRVRLVKRRGADAGAAGAQQAQAPGAKTAAEDAAQDAAETAAKTAAGARAEGATR